MRNSRTISLFLRNNFYKSAAMLTLILIFIYFTWNTTRSDAENYDWSKLENYKLIFAHNVPEWLQIQDGIDEFNDSKCPYNKCRWTTRKAEKEIADLVLFILKYVPAENPRPPGQIYALYLFESPPHTSPVSDASAINWTITYRSDSTIPAPYRKWIPFNPEIKQQTQNINYAENKTKQVAWFVSNCNDKNGRLKYARELQKHIQVDIYGKCGSLSCPRDNLKKCYDMLDRDYKFYLAFENSNCKDYITEKLFDHALGRNILPVVMGASQDEYTKYAPQRSFIHVDEFETPAELAQYLKVLDTNDDLYNSYFQWKGSGRVVNEHKQFMCEMCARLHDDRIMSTPSWYTDINEWWRGPGVCTTGSWRDVDISKNFSNRYCFEFIEKSQRLHTPYSYSWMRK
ncbi:glycoprotein 3-alpha-L-fucosyltransferase A-like [Sitodiplosis mosellana]|uniref:glycoprotein 3-alpha-L-fucosyltransferase A-like n=1 Tax=Sitodiplosis mosellana TaxID=263140 RepID=UPI002444F64D|nr:glycoprotein 3-alpha-L-fucosyltransferase A-like [Sitodiplosis mosellana]